jgi:hypothetical protein
MEASRMTTRIRFDKSVPEWLRRHCRRWFRLLFPDDWRMHIAMQDAEEMEAEHGEGTAAVTISLPTYLDAAVWFGDEIENREDVWRVVCHEFLHAHHAPVTELFNLAWDGRRKMDKKDVARMLADLIEQMIQREVAIIAKIKKLP